MTNQVRANMRRPVALRLQIALATTAVAGAIGLVLPMTQASAAVGTATGFATSNGGTTGGAGGQTVRATTGTAIHAALCGRASSSTPITIEVQGTINHGNTTKVSGASCNTAAGVIELKQISNVTIIGVGSGAVFDQLGIHIREARNIIIQNVTVRNVKKSGSPLSNGGDAISMESNVRNIWVDHVTLEASGGEAEGFDGLFDMKNNTQYVTLSYSILRNSGRGGLIGSSETDLTNGFVTFHHNLYENLDSRAPLLRGGIAHIYNNSYVGLQESGINSRAGARAKVENNYFKNSRDVLGTFYTDAAGYWQVSGNVFDGVTWSARSAENNPAGPNPVSNTTVGIPYSYSLDGASCVPGIVAQTAGANKGLQVSGGNCSPQNPPTSSSTPRPSNPAPSSPAPSRSAPSSPAPSSQPPGNSAGCTATYAIVGQWGGGFQGDVKVTAGGAINGWTVTWTFGNGQSIQSAWNATVTSSGSSVTARNVSYNGKLSAGQSTNFGFTGSFSGSNGAPSVSCTAS